MKAKFLAAIVAVGLLTAGQVAMAQQPMYGAPSPYGAPVQQSAYAGQMQAAYVAQMQAAYAGQMQGGPMGPVPAPTPAMAPQGPYGPCMGNACEEACRQPEWRFWGDFLYMRARDAEVPYAVIADGTALPPPATPVQVAPYSMVDPDYEPAFRVGFTREIDEFSCMGAEYMRFESSTQAEVSTTAPQWIRSMLIHPRTWSADSDGLHADAEYGIDLQMIDATYRYTFFGNGRSFWTIVGGASYAQLDQDFWSSFGTNGVTSVTSDIKFDGAGLRLGLETERYARSGGFMVYGKGNARFLAGEFDATHIQGIVPGDPQQVYTGWEAGRIVTILDLELGLGWSSANGCLNVSGGYMVSGWLNTVKMADWMAAVRDNDLSNLGDTLTFDGVVGRVELRF